MIDFRPIRLADRAVIECFTMPSTVNNCDLAFANIYSWQTKYHTSWAIIEDNLILRFHIDGGNKIGYMQPLGSTTWCSEVIDILREDAVRYNQPLRIVGLDEDGAAMLRSAHPDKFAYWSDRDMEDYLYDSQALASLTGRKYQPKRNHINRFESRYDYTIETLGAQHFDECIALERKWRGERIGHSEEQSAELQAIRRSFANFDELGLRGVVLKVADQIVAFSYGSPLNRSTFVVHVEKADTQFEGSYSMICKQLAQLMATEFSIINREEDMGIEGLRKSKLSYMPMALQKKYWAIELSPAQAECRELWREVFGDSDQFIDQFLINHYSADRMLTRYVDGKLVAMTHIIMIDTQHGKLGYIYAVATHPDHRGKGYASQLMRSAMQIIMEQCDLAALIPATESLRQFYNKHQFSGSVPIKIATPDNFDFGSGNPELDIAMIWHRDTKLDDLFEQLEVLKGRVL